MLFFIVDKIRLHDVPRRVKVGLFYFRTFGRVETIMKGDFANLVEVLMIDVRAFLGGAVYFILAIILALGILYLGIFPGLLFRPTGG
jgi:hypothetical protein